MKINERMSNEIIKSFVVWGMVLLILGLPIYWFGKDVWKPGSLHKNLGHLRGVRQVYTGCHRILGSWDVPDMRGMCERSR